MRSKIVILLLALTAILAIHQPCIEGSQYDTQDANHWKSTRFRGSNLENGRFRKASGDDNLKTSVSNLQMVARITNGIYLQQGLISGSVPADALISELLHFGSVKPSDVAALDIAKIQAAVDVLKDLPNKLEPSGDVEKAEASFEAIHSTVERIRGSGDISSWNRTKVEEEITSLATKGVTLEQIENLDKNTSTSKVFMDLLKAESSAKSDTESSFGRLASALKSIKTASEVLDGVYWSVDGFSNITEMIRPIVQAGNAIKNNKKDEQILQPDHGNAYIAYFGSLSTSTKSVDEVATYLDVFTKLMEARQMESWNQKDLTFTSGFPTGLSDLVKLHQNLQDVWIRKVVNSTRLSTALDKLKGLEAPMQSIEDALASKEVVDHRTAITSMADNVHQIKSKDGKLRAGIDELQKCDQSGSKVVPYHPHMESIEGYLKKIDQMLAEMRTKTITLVEYLETPEIGQLCDEVIKICEKAVGAKNISTVVAEFKAYKHYEKLGQHIEEIEKKANAVKDVQQATSIQAEAKNAEAMFSELKDYHDATNNYAEYFNCLQKDGVSAVLDIFEKIKVLRADDPSRVTSMDQGLEAIKKVAGTKDALKKLKTAISAQKSFKSIETDGLALLKDGSTHSKTIGLAVRGLSNMKDASERRPDLEGLLKAKHVIAKYQKRSKDSEDTNNLGSLLSLMTQIEKMIASLDTFEQSVKPPSSNNTLVAYSEIFQKAKSVSGASGEFEKIAGTIGKLKESVTDADVKKTLGDVESTLKTMDTMGLDFAKFQKSFDGSKKSLSALDTFFASFAAQVERAIKDQKNAEQKFILILIALAIGFILVFSFGTFAVWIRRCRAYIWWKIFSCCRKKFSKEDYVLLIVRYFHKAIKDHEKANRKILSEDEPAYKNYFETHFLADNGDNLVDLNRCLPLKNLESLCNEPLLKATRVKVRGLQDDYYHASILRLLNGAKWLLCQTPLQFGKDVARMSTVRPFWYMVSQQKSKRIFMLNPLEYGEDDRVKYSPYFPQKEGEILTFDDVKVTCKKEKIVCEPTTIDDDLTRFERLLQTRELSVTIGNQKPFTVTHYWIDWWKTGTVPYYLYLVANLIRFIMDGSEDKGPPVIHCGDGISETGIVAFVGYCVTMALVERKVDFSKCLKEVRRYRADCLQSRWAYALAAYLLVKHFRKGMKKGQNEEFDEKYEFLYREFMKMMTKAEVEKAKAPADEQGGGVKREKKDWMSVQEILDAAKKEKQESAYPRVHHSKREQGKVVDKHESKENAPVVLEEDPVDRFQLEVHDESAKSVKKTKDPNPETATEGPKPEKTREDPTIEKTREDPTIQKTREDPTIEKTTDDPTIEKTTEQ